MNTELERNLGEQPLAKLLAELALKAGDLVKASPEPLTRKMIARACKGRRLTVHAQSKVLRALNQATGRSFARSDLFTY